MAKVKSSRRRKIRKVRVSLSQISKRSQSARQRALHVLAAMRRDPNLSLSRAAKDYGIKPGTVWKKFPKDFIKFNGKFRATKSDRHRETLYIPNAQGNYVPIETRSSKIRKEAGRYKRDLNRHLRGNRDALKEWHDKKIAGVKVLTDPSTIKAIESALPDYSLYRTFSGGGA